MKKVACLCPTYKRPICTKNSVAVFNLQTYPEKRLYILDDGGSFEEFDSPNVKLKSSETRFESLPKKYNFLLDWAMEDYNPDIIMVWENDDIFLPNHIEEVVRNLENAEVYRPKLVFVYDPVGKKLRVNEVYLNFHGSLSFSSEVVRLGIRWPETKKAAFDLYFLHNLETVFRTIRAETFPTYVFRMPCTEAINGECLMHGPDDEEWYERYRIHIGRDCCPQKKIPLVPEMDEETKYFFNVFIYSGIANNIVAYYKNTKEHLMP